MSYRAFWQRRCRAAAAGAVLKPLGGNCAVLPYIPESLIPRNPENGALRMPNAFGCRFVAVHESSKENADDKIQTEQPDIRYDAFLDAGIALHFHVPLLPQLGLCIDGHCAGFNADEAAGPRQKDWRGAVHCGAGVLCLVLSRSVRLTRADPVGAEHQDFAELRVLLRQLRGVFSAFLKKGLAKNFNYFHELHYRQYRIILSADTASKVRQMLSQKRR